jgi:hypothetical protein
MGQARTELEEKATMRWFIQSRSAQAMHTQLQGLNDQLLQIRAERTTLMSKFGVVGTGKTPAALAPPPTTTATPTAGRTATPQDISAAIQAVVGGGAAPGTPAGTPVPTQLQPLPNPLTDPLVEQENQRRQQSQKDQFQSSVVAPLDAQIADITRKIAQARATGGNVNAMPSFSPYGAPLMAASVSRPNQAQTLSGLQVDWPGF